MLSDIELSLDLLPLWSFETWSSNNDRLTFSRGNSIILCEFVIRIPAFLLVVSRVYHRVCHHIIDTVTFTRCNIAFVWKSSKEALTEHDEFTPFAYINKCAYILPFCTTSCSLKECKILTTNNAWLSNCGPLAYNILQAVYSGKI